MRLKLPAYAKRLLDDRRAGKHPLEVNLVFGDKWRDVPEIRVCIPPEDYAPALYDFRVLAGLRVTIHDQMNFGNNADSVFFDLVGEVAAAQALVIVRWPKGHAPREIHASELAFCCRVKTTKGVQWPRWWSAALHTRQQQLAVEWLEDYGRKVA
jgi:hypothetical protein